MFTTPPSLLERLRQSPEQEAWENFVELYTPLFFAWAGRLGLNPHDAADAVQDLFTVLVEKLPGFRYDERQSFRAWLRTILNNRWRNRLRRRSLENAVSLNGLAHDIADADVPDLADEEYRRHLVQRALALMQAEFEPATWKACWEYVVRDRPVAEVAAELGLTVNAVYLAKSRVLRRLRAELAGLLE